MPTTHATMPQLASEPTPVGLHLAGRTILLATDGSPASHAAARVAHALAARHDAEVQVLNVIDSRPAPMPYPLDLAVAVADETIGDTVRTQRADGVRDDLALAVGEPLDWRVRVALGSPAGEIVQEGRRLHAALVVAGLRQHGRVERAFQDETTLEVMRRATCPVLGVAADATDLPRKVLAAVDFSESSRLAAHAARAVMREGGTIVLAYTPPVSFDLPDDGEATVHELGVAAGFARYRAELEREGARVDHVVLHRELAASVPDTLIEYATSTRCDLIAAGSARRGRLDRWMLGSVSTDLVREGRRSVLIVPPRPVRISETPIE